MRWIPSHTAGIGSDHHDPLGGQSSIQHSNECVGTQHVHKWDEEHQPSACTGRNMSKSVARGVCCYSACNFDPLKGVIGVQN